jgi:hypothetical protein
MGGPTRPYGYPHWSMRDEIAADARAAGWTGKMTFACKDDKCPTCAAAYEQETCKTKGST